MLSEVRSTVRYRNWNARWNGGGTACSFGGLGHDVARPDGGDAGLGEAAGVVADGVDELGGAEAVGQGVAADEPHHEAAAAELRHLHVSMCPWLISQHGKPKVQLQDMMTYIEVQEADGVSEFTNKPDHIYLTERLGHRQWRMQDERQGGLKQWRC